MYANKFENKGKIKVEWNNKKKLTATYTNVQFHNLSSGAECLSNVRPEVFIRVREWTFNECMVHVLSVLSLIDIAVTCLSS